MDQHAGDFSLKRNPVTAKANFGPWQRRVKLQLPFRITSGVAQHGQTKGFVEAIITLLSS